MFNEAVDFSSGVSFNKSTKIMHLIIKIKQQPGWSVLQLLYKVWLLPTGIEDNLRSIYLYYYSWC